MTTRPIPPPPLRVNRWHEARVQAGLSITELARATGINIGLLSLLEQGRYIPNPLEAEAILRATRPPV